MEITADTTYISRSGQSRYYVLGIVGNRCYVQISVWPNNGWVIANPRTSFRTSHVQKQIETGNWKAV